MSKNTSTQWRMKEKCDNCPFHEAGPGRQLRDSLMPGRFKEIAEDLLKGKHFFCHKTTTDDDWDNETGDYFGRGLVCAGAIEFQNKHKVNSQYSQIRERIEQMMKMERQAMKT